MFPMRIVNVVRQAHEPGTEREAVHQGLVSFPIFHDGSPRKTHHSHQNPAHSTAGRK